MQVTAGNAAVMRAASIALRGLSSSSSGASPWHCQRLQSRCAVRVRGKEAASFLQGLITNDINHLAGVKDDSASESPHHELFGGASRVFHGQDAQRSMFALMLNTQGRVIFDTIVFKDKEEDVFVLDCDAKQGEAVVKHLRMYRVRRKIDIDPLDSVSVMALCPECADDVPDFPGEVRCEGGQNLQGHEMTFKAGGDFLCTVDPRTLRLGFRLLVDRGKEDSLKKCISDTELSGNDDHYTRLRYSLGISEGADEMPSGKCFPLEYNADYLHGVSFHKGCYIGQELTARTHHTGVIRKRIMPLKLSKDDAVAIESGVVDEKGKSVGKLRAQRGTLALGLMRVQECLSVAGPLKVAGTELAVEVQRPRWWPQEAPKEKQSKT